MATPEVQLARRLASNDYKTRKKAEKALKKWLGAKALKGMKEVEIQRLWKGLFACMFMSDKPLVQEQLATDLASLIHLFSNYEQGMLFCKVFFDTMAREWHGIDRLRLDKYYMFIRRFVKESHVYLQAQGWPESGTQRLMEAIVSQHEECPGIIHHISELFLPEISNLHTKVSESTTQLLLEPWIQLVASSKDSVLVESIKTGILDRLVHGHKVKRLSINWSELDKLITTLSSKPETLARNRKILYQFLKQIKEKATPPSSS